MIKIAPYTEKYKSHVVQLVLDIYENEFNFKGFERPDIYSISATYQNGDDSNFWVALDGEKLVGTVGLLKKTDKLCYIKRMVVKKEFRRMGLGENLLKMALAFAKEHGFKTVYAGTVEENPNAIAFYMRHGFFTSKNVPEDITAANGSVCLQLDF